MSSANTLEDPRRWLVRIECEKVGNEEENISMGNLWAYIRIGLLRVSAYSRTTAVLLGWAHFRMPNLGSDIPIFHAYVTITPTWEWAITKFGNTLPQWPQYSILYVHCLNSLCSTDICSVGEGDGFAELAEFGLAGSVVSGSVRVRNSWDKSGQSLSALRISTSLAHPPIHMISLDRASQQQNFCLANQTNKLSASSQSAR